MQYKACQELEKNLVSSTTIDICEPLLILVDASFRSEEVGKYVALKFLD
jgi:hypothetical protein